MSLKRVSVFASVLFSTLVFLFSLFGIGMPFWTPKIILGIDLRGGSSIKLQVNTDLLEYYEKNFIDNVKILNQSDDSINIKKDIYKINPSSIEIDKRYFISANTNIFDKKEINNIVVLTLNNKHINDIKKSNLNRSINVIKKRIKDNDVSIYSEDIDKIIIESTGIEEDKLKDIIVKPAKLEFSFLDEKNGKKEMIYEGNKIKVTDKVFDGSYISNTNTSTDTSSKPCILFSLDSHGSNRFAEITKENIGKTLVISLDDKVLSMTTIKIPIYGSGIIDGNFTIDEAKYISTLINSGSLPTNLYIVSENKIEPYAGRNDIINCVYALIISIIFISCTMMYRYSLLIGLLSSLCLIISFIVAISIVIIFKIPLTLQSIVNSIISIVCMGTISSALINSSIKENGGFNNRVSIVRGYKKAMKTVFNFNIVILLGSTIIYLTSSSAIRAFSIVLCIGSFISMFVLPRIFISIIGIFKDIDDLRRKRQW